VTASLLASAEIRPRVLLADGDSDSRRRCADSLTLAGCRVIEAAEGRDALIKVLTIRLSIVITDLRLDFIDGISLCDILRRGQTSADVPILIVTSAADAARLPLSTRSAVDGLVIKPGPPTVILEEMQRLLKPRHSIAPTPVPSPFPHSVPTKDYGSVSTTSPIVPPLVLSCPICCRCLTYRQTCLRRVTRDRVERWDDFDCASCGQFQYRWRTRKLRHLTNRARLRSVS
jgi:CheY-like chemotaxis protein